VGFLIFGCLKPLHSKPSRKCPTLTVQCLQTLIGNVEILDGGLLAGDVIDVLCLGFALGDLNHVGGELNGPDVFHVGGMEDGGNLEAAR
jgi:hypothetical protein